VTIRFLKGEELTARKMNDLSAVAHRGAVRGNLQRSPDGALAGIGNTQNYIPQFVPLYPERLTGTSLIVRGGAWEHYTGDTRSITSLTCDGGASRNPEDVKTLTPTLAASTAYSVYLELTTGAGTLTANVIDTASFPADAAGKRRYLLAEFTTSAAATIPDIDPLNGDLITGQAEATGHSWHFTAATATTGTISDALFYYQGDKQTIAESSAALAGAGPWTLTLSSSHTHFYLEVDTSSAATFTLKSGTSFPNAGSETRIYPILEFTDSADTASCIEHQQSDIHLDIPPPKTASTDHGALVVDAGVISWAYASEDRQFLQRKADDTIDFDLPRRN